MVVLETDGRVNAVAFLPGGGLAVAGTQSLAVWDDGRVRVRHAHPCRKLAVSPCGGWLVTDDDNKFGVRAWPTTGGPAVPLLDPGFRMFDFDFDAAGRLLVYTTTTRHAVVEWVAFPSGRRAGAWDGLPQPDGWSIAAHPSQPLLAVADRRAVGVWDTDWRERVGDRDPLPPVDDVLWSPAGDRLAAVCVEELIVLDATDGRLPVVATVPLPQGNSAAFHPSGRWLAVATRDSEVRLYDATSWQLVRTLALDIGRLKCVAFSPDGLLAAAGSDDGPVAVWDVDP